MKVPVERDVAAQQQPLHLSMAALDEFLPPMPPRRPLPEPLMATSGRPRGGNGHRRDGRHGDAGAGDGRHGDAGAGDGAPPLDERADACALPPIASRALRTASLEERAAARAAARSPRGARERGPAPPARPAGSSGDAPGASLFVYDGPWGSKAAASLPLRRPLPIAAVAPPAPLLSPEAAAAAAAHAAAAYVTSTAALSSLGGSTVDAHAPGVPSRVPRLRLKRDGTLASALDAAALARWSASSRLAPESAMAPPPLGAPRSARDRAPLRGLRLASAEAAAGDAVRAAAAALGVGGVGVSPRVARDAAARVVLRVTDPRALPPGRRARPRLPARVAAEALGGPPRSLQPQPSVIAPGPWSYGEESAGALDGLRASAPVDGGGVNSALPQMSPLHSSRRLPRWWTAHGGAPTGQPASLHGGGGSLVLDRVIGSPPSPLRGAASLDAFSARGATPRQRSQRRARALWQLLRRRVIRPAAASRRFHNLAAARAAAEEHIASSGVVTELPHGADPSSVPARQQGNLLFYTTGALEARRTLKNHAKLKREIDLHWERLVRGKPDGQRRITFEEYAGTFSAFLRELAPETRKYEAWKIVQSEWANDAKSKSDMTYDKFYAALFDVLDTWCDSLDVADYIELSRRLYQVALRLPPVNYSQEHELTMRRYSRPDWAPVRVLKAAGGPADAVDRSGPSGRDAGDGRGLMDWPHQLA